MLVYTYMIYLLLSLLITIWVGRVLQRNGRVFLIANYAGKIELADAINHLLLAGFYLVNGGFICLALKYGVKPTSPEEGIEFLSTKIGTTVIVLGAMHFFNIWALIKLRHFKIEPQIKPTRIPEAADWPVTP